MKIARFLSEKNKISVEISEKLVTVTCDKLLKFRDEYNRKIDKKSGQYPDNV